MKRRRVTTIRSTLALALLGLAIVLGACATNNAPPADSVTSVTIDQGDSSLAVGDTLALTATVKVVGSASTAVTWSSSNATIASVSSSGTVTAHAVGSATITATSVFDTTKKGSISVTVGSTTVDPNNIYVDDSAAPGGNGSIAAPFQTIAEGIAAVNTGGTVHILAGTYPEDLYLTKALTLSGAGRNSVVIVVDANATGPASSAGMVVHGVSGVTLRDFTLRAVAPGPTDWVLAAFGGTSNLTLQRVLIEDTLPNSSLSGLEIYAVTTATIQDVEITAPGTAPSNGRGLFIGGGSSNVQATGLTTSGHDGWAGVVLDPMGATMSNLTVQGSFAEVNKLQASFDSGGSVVGLTADQFHFVARNLAAAYGSGNKWFYKESRDVALADALFNFDGDGQGGALSFVQLLDPSDEGSLLNEFVAGSIFGGGFGYAAETRSSNIQSAIDAASANAVITVLDGTFDRALSLDKAGLTITGNGAGSILTADPLPVLTVSANGVTVTNVQLAGSDTANSAVTVGNVTGFALTHSNLLTELVLDNAGGNAVDATFDYWGNTGGPDSNDVTGGNVDSSNAVDVAWP